MVLNNITPSKAATKEIDLRFRYGTMKVLIGTFF
jgi:hypothetical protein